MGQVSPVLRSTSEGFSHWCPGCKEMHHIYTKRSGAPSWTFDGNVVSPTFSPSIHIRGKEIIKDADGNWKGGWERDDDGCLIDTCCHYFIRGGQIEFCSDSTHDLKGKTIPLPTLPEAHQDPL